MSGSPPSLRPSPPVWRPGSDDGDRPAVVVCNTGDESRHATVRRRRDGRDATDRVALAPGEIRALAVPGGTGPATIDLQTPCAAATTTFDPATGRLAPLFTLCAEGVVVVRD